MNSLFAITLGDPCGIGVEITLKALKAKPEYLNSSVLFGCYDLVQQYNQQFSYDFPLQKIAEPSEIKEGVLSVYDPLDLPRSSFEVGVISATGGEYAFQSVVSAIDWAKKGYVSSVVTAPLNKEALHCAGHIFAGHTEIFAEYTQGASYGMLLWSERLKCIHSSTHIALRDACNVTKERVEEVIKLGYETLKKVGYDSPRIAVAGLNPHAGENGLFGQEEIVAITPAIEACQKEGIPVTGPVPPDTVFLRAYKGEFDLVVAMYHDQGHIPLKLLAFDSGVNITVGLDVIRTSVDHGTAFDIAGTNKASEESILSAIALGMKL